MKMKALLLAAMFATSGLMAQSAQAAAPYFDVEYETDGSFSGTFGHTFSSTTPKDFAFDEAFTFTVSSGFNSSTSITSAYNTVGAKISDLSITGFKLVRYNPVTQAVLNVVLGTNKTLPVTLENPHPDDNWSLHADNLAAGSYYIEVIGKTNGTASVSYSGNISVLTVSAVPEAETYGMMLAGLGMLGFVARRKAAKKAA